MQVHARTTLLGLSAVAALAAAPILSAQDSMDQPATATLSANAQLPGLDPLVAPIALYPDPLVGIILPASTQPNDIQTAAQSGGETGSLSPAVQDLAHYPNLVQWMASNQDWSDQLGGAFADQPSQVMDAIQDLRHRAVDAGTLHSTSQIEVYTDGDMIRILPRDANVVYIPEYDPNAVFVRGHAGVEITFGEGMPAGDWLAFYPVWRSHAVYAGDWYAYSRSHGGWHFNVAVGGGLFHRGGISGVSGSKEWHVAGNAQIKQDQFRAKAQVRGNNYARPAAFGARGQNASEQARAGQPSRNPQTFQGDEQRRQQQQTQAEQRARTEQERSAQQPAPSSGQITPSSQQEQGRQTFQGDQQRRQSQLEQQGQAGTSEQNKANEAQRQQEEKNRNRQTFPGDQPQMQQQYDQNGQGQNQNEQDRRYQQEQQKSQADRDTAQAHANSGLNQDQATSSSQGQNRQENGQANRESTDTNPNKYQQRSTTTQPSKDKNKKNREGEQAPSSAPSSPSSQ